MKWKMLLVTGVVLIAVILGTVGCDGGFFSPTPQTRTSGAVVSSQQNTGIWVTGEGKVTVVPDVAILTLGVESQAATVAEAQGLASTAMAAVIGELEAGGVDDKDIKTQQFTIYPVRRWVEEEREEELIGYRVTNMVTAKVRDVADTGTIIDAVARKMGFASDKVIINIEKYGNTTAGTIPIAMSEAYRQNMMAAGDWVLMAAFGAGFTWGSVLLKWAID